MYPVSDSQIAVMRGAKLLEKLQNLRPWLYHLTSRDNLPLIRASWELRSAKTSLAAAGRELESGEKRANSWVVDTPDGTIALRDQRPLHAGNIEFAEGWGFREVVELLNQFVFFWPGREDGPMDYGRRHFERYREERPVVIRVRTSDVLEVTRRQILVCGYNSGAPRCSGGKKSPRGPDTFVEPWRFGGTASKVVEVVVPDAMPLPMNVEVGDDPAGPFSPMDRSR